MLEDAENELPFGGRALLRDLGEELRHLDERVKRFEKEIKVISVADPAGQRLQGIPGIGYGAGGGCGGRVGVSQWPGVLRLAGTCTSAAFDGRAHQIAGHQQAR